MTPTKFKREVKEASAEAIDNGIEILATIPPFNIIVAPVVIARYLRSK